MPEPLQTAGLITLVEGSSFCLSDRAGDVTPGGANGLFALDFRLLSQWELVVDGQSLEPLSLAVTEPFAATFASRLPPAKEADESTVLVVRRRWVGAGMREDIEIHNYSSTPATHKVELHIASDLADLFHVKAGHILEAPQLATRDGHLRTRAMRHGIRHDVDVREHSNSIAQGDARLDAAGLCWRVTVPAKSSWRTCLEVSTSIDDVDLPVQYRCGEPTESSKPSLRLQAWRGRTPTLRVDDERISQSVARAVEDLGSLIIEDPAHPESPVIAAGAPWYMALFGRDSLITSYMSMIVDPSLAVGVLQTLARLQGTKTDVDTEEQPGRIPHEVRFISRPSTAFDDGHVYYGTADATPLFVMLVAELNRWGSHPEVVEELMPHVDRALAWISADGDPDGDGYVEYQRLSPDGLANQGWKDSWDGINNVDGQLAVGPIALAEVQAYVYAALIGRGELARGQGDDFAARTYATRAMALKVAFNRDFWLPDRGWFAIALDGAKRPVDALASNLGHCLWSGIIDADHAPQVAQRLSSPSMFTGWGVRTLSADMGRYNPLSYHNGSVWPHDSAIAAAGLMRYGFVSEAHNLMDGLLSAAEASGWRLPELFAGVDRDELAIPVAYPASCSPQAWAAAAPLLILRTMLRLEPRLDLGQLSLDPIAGAVSGLIELNLANARMTLRIDDSGCAVSGLPADVVVSVGTPRPAAVHESPS